MRRIALPALCATVVLVAAPAMAQITAGQSARTSLVPRNSVPGNRDEDLIRSWYRDYLGREVGPELKAWTELLRGGMSALDVQATILGSDEFYNQKGRDAQTFVLETLQSITWEEPSAAELRRWTDRLRTLRGDRLELAREMLLASGELGDSSPQTGSNQVDIANRLTAATRLLVDTIDFEIGGTTQGRQANLKAQALADAAEQYRRATTPVGTRSLDRRQAEQAHLAVDGARRSLIALQSTLSNPPGTALSATNVARRVGDILEEADETTHGGGSISDPVTPPRNTPPRNSPANAKLLTQVAAASRAVESIIQSLTGQANQSYSTSVVLRDLDSFAAKLDQLQTSIEDGVSRERLGWEVETLRTQAGRIGPQLLAGRPPAFTRLFWSSVESSLEQMGETLGLRAADLTDVLRPAPTTSQVLPLVDQALSRSDVFLTGTQPLVFGVPEVPRVQRDVRTIKSRLLTLRQEAQNGEPAAQQLATLNSMVADYKSAFDRWNQIVTLHRLQSPPRLSPIGEALNEVERLLKVELEFEDFAPAASVSSSRAGRLIATLSPELRLVREALPVFVNYPEHRALLTYCDQLDGYLASLTDLQRSPAAAPDAQRRQIAAMQRTAELLAATADAVAARAQGAGGRAVDAGARLAAQARRFASLVNDLESELN